MREARKTFNQNKQISRMFTQGREASEVWFRGDLIFKKHSLPTIKELVIDGEYNNLIKIGSYVVAYNGEAPGTIAKMKSGIVSYETITSHSVKAFGIPKQEMIVMIDMVDSKIFFVKSDGVVEYAISEALKPYLARLNVRTNKLFIVNNLLYLGTFFTDQQGYENHLFNAVCMIGMDSDMNPTNELIYESYAINPAATLNPDTEYAVNKVVIDIEYDEASDSVFLIYPTKYYNGNLTIRYIKAMNFNGLTFDEATLISSGEQGVFSVVNLTVPTKLRVKVGRYSIGAVDRYQSDFSFGYVISNYEGYLLSRTMGSTARYQFEIQMRGAACGYWNGKYYTISDDNEPDVWYSPPLILNPGIWASDDPKESDFEKITDTLEPWSSETFLFGTGGEYGLYFIYGNATFRTIIRYVN